MSEVPKLQIRYPEPSDPAYGTASTYFDVEALKGYGAAVTEYLEGLERRVRIIEQSRTRSTRIRPTGEGESEADGNSG